MKANVASISLLGGCFLSAEGAANLRGIIPTRSSPMKDAPSLLQTTSAALTKQGTRKLQASDSEPVEYYYYYYDDTVEPVTPTASPAGTGDDYYYDDDDAVYYDNYDYDASDPANVEPPADSSQGQTQMFERDQKDEYNNYYDDATPGSDSTQGNDTTQGNGATQGNDAGTPGIFQRAEQDEYTDDNGYYDDGYYDDDTTPVVDNTPEGDPNWVVIDTPEAAKTQPSAHVTNSSKYATETPATSNLTTKTPTSGNGNFQRYYQDEYDNYYDSDAAKPSRPSRGPVEIIDSPESMGVTNTTSKNATTSVEEATRDVIKIVTIPHTSVKKGATLVVSDAVDDDKIYEKAPRMHSHTRTELSEERHAGV